MNYYAGYLTRAMKLQLAAIAIVVGVVAFFLGVFVIWPAPSAEEMAQSMAMGMGGDAPPPMYFNVAMWSAQFLEAIAFGCGVVFALVAYQRFSNLTRNRTHGMVTFYTILWTMLSWWPHDNLHRIRKPGDLNALLRLEVGFHLTLCASAFVIGSFIYRMLAPAGKAEQSTFEVSDRSGA